MTTLKANALSAAVSKETVNTQLTLIKPVVATAASLIASTTIKCAYCGCAHTYIKKRKAKKFCSNKCGVTFHGKFVRNKAALAARITAYYTKNYAKRLIVTSKRSAKDKGFQHDLSEAHLKNQLTTGKCQVTGLPVSSNIGSGQRRGAYSPSLDRIDNAVGYIDSNVRIVRWQYNLAKGKFSDRDLNNLAVAITASHLSPEARETFKALLPANLVANLPAGFAL